MGKSKTKRARNIITFDKDVLDDKGIIRTEELKLNDSNKNENKSESKHVKEHTVEVEQFNKEKEEVINEEQEDKALSGAPVHKNSKKLKSLKDKKHSTDEQEVPEEPPAKKSKKQKKKTKKNVDESQEQENVDYQKESAEEIENDEQENDSDTPPDINNIQVPKPPDQPSKRALKRQKYVKLLEEKKLKSDMKLQEGALNYLSKWKHSRTDWKFEKLKQIWLQQNLFDSNKIPEEFWETLLEYFGGSKGAIRKVVMDRALKIIEEMEKMEKKENENDDEDKVCEFKLKRARDVVQYL